MKIEFVIPAYGRPMELMCCLSSLFSQTNSNFLIHVIADAPFDGFDQVIDYFKDDERLRVTTLNGPHKDWGHTARNYGLDHAQGDWIVMTSDDNYYIPTFVNEFLKVVTPQTGFVYCDVLLDHPDKKYTVLDTRIQVYHIDIGQFMIRKDLVGNLRLDKTKHAADGHFAVDYHKQIENEFSVTKINKVLYVHN